MVLNEIYSVNLIDKVASSFPEKESNIPSGEEEIIETCSSYNLFNASYCVNEQINTFYLYNLSNRGKILNYSSLRSSGGTCVHYTKLITRIMEKLGFKVEEVSFYNDDRIEGHIFNIVYDANVNGYCLMDSNLIECVKLK